MAKKLQNDAAAKAARPANAPKKVTRVVFPGLHGIATKLQTNARLAQLPQAKVTTTVPDLGLLAQLLGPGLGPATWSGPGFNVVALPFFKGNTKFQVMVNSTNESFTFTQIPGLIPNRGNIQPDIEFRGITYMQKVDDAVTGNGLHVEPGIFLNLPANDVQQPASIARLATVPHGDSLLAQGPIFPTLAGPPPIGVADATPFTLDAQGNRVNDTSPTYLSVYANALMPPGVTLETVMDPNRVLSAALAQQAAAGSKVIKTDTFIVNATPVGGINGTQPSDANVGGVTNIPFVVQNADANSVSAIFWIETVQNADGSTTMQLQYTQTVILDFPVPGPDGKPVDIKWPHISVATLVKQPS